MANDREIEDFAGNLASRSRRNVIAGAAAGAAAFAFGSPHVFAADPNVPVQAKLQPYHL